MAQENVGRFEELLKSDEALQAKFAELGKAFEGTDADDRALFEGILAPLAAEAGLPFTYEEGVAYASQGKELSDDELDAVAGGFSVCYIIGGGDEPDADSDCKDGRRNIGACAYIGVTWGGFD